MHFKPSLFLAFFAIISSSACAAIESPDRLKLSDFRINPDQTFTYTAEAIIASDKTIETAPVGHESYLKEWLRQNRMCPNGYAIQDRQAVRTAQYLTGQGYRVTYVGACT